MAVISVDEHGRSELHYAAMRAEEALAKELIEAGLDVNLRDSEGWTPLHFAAQAGSLPVARLLLKAGAQVDARDRHGNTPLFRAVFESRGSGSLIQILRANGADPHAANLSGQTPVGLARLIGNFDVAQFFSDVPVRGR